MNNKLFYWKKADSIYCEYCKPRLIKQTPVHLFWECTNVQKIWEHMSQFITKCMRLDTEHEGIVFNAKTVMLNTVHPHCKHITNFLVQVTKQYIYACKCQRVPYNFKEAINRFENIYYLEQYNAIKKNRLFQYEIKWAPYTGTKVKKCTPLDQKNTTNINNFIHEYVTNM